uniref:Uncharacterized protein n=1 Tax=Arundo donax TaxID=35708 RepID=A0A0A9FUT2_ARUDO
MQQEKQVKPKDKLQIRPS